MDNLKRKLEANPKLLCAVGLRDATTKEINDIKVWLKERSIKYIHKVLFESGKRLSYNGVLQINFKTKKKTNIPRNPTKF